ncbi:uncharacterized protein LOC121731253 [Aricia agestis]|uniref:uncharacterized protein LOC121731253 n=1 Tax=Aricia agestis TaxID=91739 RepID=UPI001C202971|nr:uncharacterized protein LOC121731253 [Aricia agestis]
MDEYETSFEPMDVDISANSTSAMDISYTELPDISQMNCSRSPIPNIRFMTETQPENNDHISSQNTQILELKEEKTYNSYRSLFIIIIVCLLSIGSYHIFSYKCFEDFRSKSISQRLYTRLYGQTVAIENVIEFLDLQHRSKVLVLYGGTGVGKTFMVSLIFEDFFNHTNIYHYSMTNLEKAFTAESMFGVTLCQTSVMIIDDITLDNEIGKYVEELIARSSNLNKNITIILIYNCANFDKHLTPNCPNDFLPELESKFTNIDAAKKFVKFGPLTKDSLKKCIQYELKENINETDLTKMMKNFDVERDGCKGVHQKTKYLNVI